MPTLRQKLQEARDAGFSDADIAARFSKIGFKRDDIDLDYNDALAKARTRKTGETVTGALPFLSPEALKPVETVEGVPVPMMPTPRDVAETPEERQIAAEMQAVPIPEEAGPAPSVPTAAQTQAMPDTPFVRKGGLLRAPVETAEFVGGAVKGLGEKVAESLLPYVPGVPGAARLAAIRKGEEETLRTMEATREELAKTRAQRKEDGFVSGLAQDVAVVVGGLANLVGTVLIGTQVEEADPKKPVDLVKAGEALGRALPAAVATQAIEAVRNPIETAQTAPFTTALTLVPLAMTAANATRGTAAAARAAEVLERVKATKIPFSGPKWEKFKRLTQDTYRGTIDALETGSPEANVLLDELITTGKRIEAEFGDETSSVPRATTSTAPPSPAVATERFGFRQPATDKKKVPLTRPEEPVPFVLTAEQAAEAEAIGQKVFNEVQALTNAPGNRGKLEDLNAAEMLALVKNTVNKKIADATEAAGGALDAKVQERLYKQSVQDIRRQLQSGRQGQLLDEEFSNFIKPKSEPVAKQGITKGEGGGMTETAEALVEAAAEGKPLPNFIRASQPTGATSKEELIAQINSLRTPDNAAAVEKAIAHVNRLDPIIDYGRTSISGLVNPAIKGWLEGSKTFVKQSQWSALLEPAKTLLSDIPKKVALPINPKAMVNNVIGNEVATSVAYGELPFANVLRYALTRGKDKAKLLSPEQQQYLASARRAGLFEANVIKADVEAASALENVVAGTVGKPFDFLAEKGGELMQMGDNIYRVSGGFKEWKKAKDIANSLTDGQFMQVPVSPNVSVRITRKGTGLLMQKVSLGKKVGIPKPISTPALNDLLARYAKNQMDAYYFDYSRVPAFITELRKAPAIGAGSPFYTWGFKALDIPFVKQGLMSAVLKSPTNIVTNSASANAKLITDAALLGIKRAGLIAATRDEAVSNPEMARMMSYDPKNPATLAFKSLGNPAQVGVARYSSANFLEPTLSLLDLASNFTDGFTESDIEKFKAADPQGAEFALLMKRLQREATTKRDFAPTILKLVGLGGGIMLDVFTRALDADEQGKRFDPMDFVKAYVPGPARAFVFGEGANERFRQVEPGMKAAESALDWHIRNVIGLGYQTINTQDQYQRFKRGVQREMETVIGKWKAKRKAQLAERMGDNEALAKAEDEAEKLKDIVTLSIEDMDAYWENKFGIETQARK